MTKKLPLRPNQRRIALAITGASGIQYGLRLLELLLKAHIEVYLVISKPGLMVTAMDTDLTLPAKPAEQARILRARFDAPEGLLHAFATDDWSAPIASGSGAPEALVVCPCTTGTLAGIAAGTSANLIERSADVMLKERRRLILLPREMPLSEIHLENMLKLARMGAIIMPPNPGFYFHPQSVEDIVDFVVARVLDQLQVAHTLLPRWGLSESS